MRIAIIGAGFGGLGMAIRLLRAGITDFTIFEKGRDVGGTWRDNTYPGAGCDIPSQLYSFSFARNRDWSRRFPGQPEILAYLEGLAAEYGIRPRVNTEVRSLTYEDGKWRVGTDRDEGLFDVVVSAVGQLNRPHYPEISGNFGGRAFHSARWEDHDLTGTRVAVIGTGSSAAQLIPPVAAKAARVEVFQRTANWVIPKPDAQSGRAARMALRVVPFLRRGYRESVFRFVEAALLPAMTGGWSEKALRDLALGHLHAQISDPALRAELTPDYPPGCKRVIIDSRFYPALTRPNVKVVTTPITRLVDSGVETADGQIHEADTIVYATGFQATGFLLPMRVTGRGGRDLHEEWKEGAQAYLGLTVPHFPNLFLLYGPSTNLAHNSIVFMLECQIRYIIACLPAIAARGPMEVTESAMAAYRTTLDDALSRTVWQAGCRSWYKTASGRVTTNWPGSASLYRRITRSPRLSAYTFAAAGRSSA